MWQAMASSTGALPGGGDKEAETQQAEVGHAITAVFVHGGAWGLRDPWVWLGKAAEHPGPCLHAAVFCNS